MYLEAVKKDCFQAAMIAFITHHIFFSKPEH